MGTLHYGSEHKFSFDDRSLNHLRTVITSKLLQRESFPFTWEDGESQKTLWITPEAHIVFEFSADPADSGALNPGWLEILMARANTPSGLQLVPEPDSEPAPAASL